MAGGDYKIKIHLTQPVGEANDETATPGNVSALTLSQYDNEPENNVLVCAVLGDAISGTFYTDITQAFPVVSLEDMQTNFYRL